MNKFEVMECLRNGGKVAHKYFTPDEWMIFNGSQYVFEDGCLCSPNDFWSTRSDESFNKDWSEYKEVLK